MKAGALRRVWRFSTTIIRRGEGYQWDLAKDPSKLVTPKRELIISDILTSICTGQA